MMRRAREMHLLKILAPTVGVALVVWGLLFAYASSPAWASTITVNSLADDADPNDGECTLREAIASANTHTTSGAAAGECAAGSGDDVIDVGVTGTVNLTGVLPDLSSNIAGLVGNIKIEGPGADEFTVRRDSGGDYRIFTVTSGSHVSISGITITNGKSGVHGGGIYNSGTLTVTDSTISGNTASGHGGGIFNLGFLTITGSTISGNSASGGSGSSGGGISTVNPLTVTDSTISGNTASGHGGGIWSNTDLEGITTTITNSTISGNSVGGGIGGGVFSFRGLTIIEHSTITNNTAADGKGSGVASSLSTDTRTEVLSSIISANANTDADFIGPTNSFLSKGYNLIGDGNATAAFNQTGDQKGVSDPGLDPLGSYGGPTQTHRLQSDSPAVDAGPLSTSCPPPDTDQRGVERPQDGDADATPTCDIGSFELDTQAPKVTSTVPGNGQEVGPAVNVKATFSEEMRPASVKRAFKLFKKGSTTQIAAQVSYDAATDKATLNPTNNLRRGVTYKAVVTPAAKDLAGNRLDQNSTTTGLQQKAWSFKVKN